MEKEQLCANCLFLGSYSGGQRMVTQKRNCPRQQPPGQVTSATTLTELLQAVLDCSGGQRMPSNSGYQTTKKAGTQTHPNDPGMRQPALGLGGECDSLPHSKSRPPCRARLQVKAFWTWLCLQGSRAELRSLLSKVPSLSKHSVYLVIMMASRCLWGGAWEPAMCWPELWPLMEKEGKNLALLPSAR